jgi:TRAP-type mannitol/chloroaromatic compound transport system substrate-binding protein
LVNYLRISKISSLLLEISNSQNMQRKTFLKSLGLMAGAGMVTSCKHNTIMTPEELANRNEKYEWKIVTTWPPNFPVLGTGCLRYAELVNKMSLGQMTIKVYGGGELIPALEVFDAVSSGAAEMGHSASYYWAGKVPASQFFASIPFGMNAQQMNAWLYSGGGIKLWEELYATYGLIPVPGGNTGVQMGGWFNRKIDTIEDFKGLKMRIPGFASKIIERVGGSSVLAPAGELYTSLERGVIDALEWIGPYHDYIMGFHEISKYYYAPGWHETGSTLEFLFNKKAFEELPEHLQTILKVAAGLMNVETLSEFEAKNNEYLQKIMQTGTVEVLKFPREVIQALKKITEEELDKLIKSDEKSAKIYASYSAFQKSIDQWSEFSEKLFYQEL